MDPHALLEKHFGNRQALAMVSRHSRMVADKALAIARNAAGAGELDLRFIEEAALLHDIGVCGIDAPKLHCFGPAPYICHGIIGREILEAEGLPRHALVCERHIGVGLTVQDIALQRLPLPEREMAPVTRCERIVAMADLFFSKREGELELEKSVEQVRRELLRYGREKVAIFDSWLGDFGLGGAE